MNGSPTKEVFVTYSWDSEDHKLRVLSFFNYLRKKGFHTDIDRKVSQEQSSIDFYKMMHSVMTDYQKVIIVLSTGYKIKADSFSGGVGTEYGLIIKDIDQNPKKYILVSFDGINDSILPLNFKGREIIDLSNPENEEILLLKLLDIPVFEIDPIASEKPIVISKQIPEFKFGIKHKKKIPAKIQEPVKKNQNNLLNRIGPIKKRFVHSTYKNHNFKIIIALFLLITIFLLIKVAYPDLLKSTQPDFKDATKLSSSERNNLNISPEDSIYNSEILKKSLSGFKDASKLSSSERDNSKISPEDNIYSLETITGELLFSKQGVPLKGITKEATFIYKEPRTSSREVGSREIFEMVYLFETVSGEKLQNGFYNVGYEPTKPRGWIKKDKIIEWDNRICLKFSSMVGRMPALIWERNDVEDLIRGSIYSYDYNGSPNKRAIAQEPGDMSRINYSMLLPALQTKIFTTGGEIKKAYKTGFLSKGNNISKKVIIPPSKGPSALLEIVFLIDATTGMGDYIESMKEVVRIVSEKASNIKGASMNIGITTYKDYVNSHNNNEVTDNVVPLTGNFNDVIDDLDKITLDVLSDEDIAEAGFDGLFTAATETAWNETKSSLRLVIWISDSSAHPPGSLKNPFNFSIEQILNQYSESRVRILGIKIASSTEDDNVHIEQLERLTQGKEAADKGYFDIIQVGPNSKNDFINKLSVQIDSELDRMNSLIKVVNRIKSGDSPEPFGKFSISKEQIIMKDLKVNSGRINSKLFNEGWIREVSTDQNLALVEEYVYITRDEIDLLITYFNATVEVIENPENKIIQVMADVISTQSENLLEIDEDLSKHYGKRFGLPSTSNLLNFSFSQVKDMGDQKLKRLHQHIKAKTKFLRSHKKEEDNWFTIPGSTLSYTFVPFSQMP